MKSSWKWTMAFIWASQYLSIMGFSFAMPFVPFFLQQDLHVTAHAELQMWVALFSASTAITMAVAAPIWGILADRYGKRIMLLRANFAGAIVLSLMGGVTSPVWLIVLRLIQGLFTGTMTAAQAMLAGSVPKENTGLALGGLSASVFSGSMTGAFLGGLVAHWVGYREAFMVSGGLLLLSGLLIMCCTKETPPVKTAPQVRTAESRENTALGRRKVLAYTWPMLAIIGGIAFARQFDTAFIPLLVQDIHGSVDGATLWSSWLMICSGVAGFAAGILMGWLSDRLPALSLITAATLLAGLFSGWQMLAHSFGVLFPVRFCTVFFAGMLEPVINSWLAKNTPRERQGIIFGLASTTRSAGWAPAPLLAGLVASFQLRAVFGVAAICFLLLAVAIQVLWRKAQRVRPFEVG